MSKALAATCEGGVVSVGELEVPSPVILSEGIAASSGVVVLDEGEAPIYIAKTSPDLKTTLQQIVTALENVATALTALDAKPIGTLPPAPSSSSAIAAITTAKSTLNTLAGNLK